MFELESAQKTRLLEYLKKKAPFSVIDLGQQHASHGDVLECSQSGSRISGIIKNTEDGTSAAHIDVISGQDVEAQCTCSSDDDINDQWCQHVVALVWRAASLGFFDPHSGFASTESVYRMNTSSPQDIASVITEISQLEHAAAQQAPYYPQVSIILDLESDRLGVRVFFDNELQAPIIFQNFRRSSSRALDNLLVQVLEEEGSWDEINEIWYINSSAGIETALSLIQEYASVKSKSNQRKVEFAEYLLDAQLVVNWLPTSSVQLEIHWVLPDTKVVDKQSEVFGTGPYWTVIDNTIYRISPSGSRIASIFPYGSTITLPRSQVGPILEAISSDLFDPEYIKILNSELQPEAKVKTPTPTLSVERREGFGEHFSSQQFELQGSLDFEYPTPPEDQNIVFLPDREKEREYTDHLRSLGFEFHHDRKKYLITGDAALDLLYTSSDVFKGKWQISGIDAVKKGIRFANLSLNVSISSQAASSRKKSAIDWFDCHVSLVQNNANVPISTLFKNATSRSDRWIRLDSGAYARVPGGGLNHLKTSLGMLDTNFRLSNTIKTQLTPAQAISLSRMEEDQLTLKVDKTVEELARRLKDFQSIEKVKVSKNFIGKLRSYQAEGLSWLHFLREFRLGGILADEMGLGKTVQALALLQTLKDESVKAKVANKPTLVIAPTSVITNWLYEARRFTPKLKVLLLHGQRRKALFNQISENDIVITSYALLRLDRPDLERHHFSYVILDEAQNIKNPQAATTKAAKALQADNRLALTGTPTENRPLELWSIMDFLMPAYLGTSEFFKTYIERPILEGGTNLQITRFLNAKTRPFILRRTKAEVEKDLPPKVESDLHVAMTQSQQELYTQILEEVRPRVFDAVTKKGIRGASVSILAALLRLRQVCNHPNSIDALKELPGFDSGKFNALKELTIEALESGKKILLFSQFREMLSIIRRWLEEEKVNYLYLDGATRDRQALVDQFNADTNVRLFLISLKAGGTGLNLAAANAVIIYDPWWNPAVEHQAIDRAHRIGQTSTVNVYRLITENSIEQKIMELKSKKARIVDALINENGLSTISLTKAELESLFEPLPTGD
jgi:superfamily II DNA or RNA helicase